MNNIMVLDGNESRSNGLGGACREEKEIIARNFDLLFSALEYTLRQALRTEASYSLSIIYGLPAACQLMADWGSLEAAFA
jgi:hypothetical protein